VPPVLSVPPVLPVPLVLPVLPCLRHLTAACEFRRVGAFFRRTMKEKWDGCSF